MKVTNILYQKIAAGLTQKYLSDTSSLDALRYISFYNDKMEFRKGYSLMADDYSNGRIDEMWEQLYDNHPAPTTEKELQDGWAEEAKGYKPGDWVYRNGKKYRVVRAYGKNAAGVHEYEIKSDREWLYADEHELAPSNTSESKEASEAQLPPVPKSSDCKHDRRYLNQVSKSLEFWVCPDCKQEVDEPKKYLTQKEIDEMFDGGDWW